MSEYGKAVNKKQQIEKAISGIHAVERFSRLASPKTPCVVLVHEDSKNTSSDLYLLKARGFSNIYATNCSKRMSRHIERNHGKSVRFHHNNDAFKIDNSLSLERYNYMLDSTAWIETAAPKVRRVLSAMGDSWQYIPELTFAYQSTERTRMVWLYFITNRGTVLAVNLCLALRVKGETMDGKPFSTGNGITWTQDDKIKRFLKKIA